MLFDGVEPNVTAGVSPVGPTHVDNHKLFDLMSYRLHKFTFTNYVYLQHIRQV